MVFQLLLLFALASDLPLAPLLFSYKLQLDLKISQLTLMTLPLLFFKLQLSLELFHFDQGNRRLGFQHFLLLLLSPALIPRAMPSPVLLCHKP